MTVPQLAEHDVLVSTDVPRLTAAQRLDLLDRLGHWLPVLSSRGPLAVRMTWRARSYDEAAEKARGVVTRVLHDSQIGGRVVDVQAAH